MILPYSIAVVFAVISVFASGAEALIAGLIMVCIGMLIEKMHKDK